MLRAIFVCVVSLVLFLAASPLHAAIITLDDFNRPDGTDMGSSWNEIAGDFQIVSGRARGSGLGSMIYVGATANTVVADLYSIGTAGDYIALILGFANTSNSIYIKLQSQNSVANFEALGFYFGNNGNNNGAWSESFFSNVLLTPFTSARVTLSLVGNTVSLSIDSNFDSTPDQVISRGSVPLGLLGTGIGLGGWSASGAEVDNFGIDGAAIPEPSTAVLFGAAGLLLLALSRRRRARS